MPPWPFSECSLLVPKILKKKKNSVLWDPFIKDTSFSFLEKRDRKHLASLMIWWCSDRTLHRRQFAFLWETRSKVVFMGDVINRPVFLKEVWVIIKLLAQVAAHPTCLVTRQGLGEGHQGTWCSLPLTPGPLLQGRRLICDAETVWG